MSCFGRLRLTGALAAGAGAAGDGAPLASGLDGFSGLVGDRAAGLDRSDAEGLPRRVVDVDACGLLRA
jgi:hypothetical protein